MEAEMAAVPCYLCLWHRAPILYSESLGSIGTIPQCLSLIQGCLDVYWSPQTGLPNLFGWVVKVAALSNKGWRFDPGSWHVVKAIGRICSPCKIVYDLQYKNRQKSVVYLGTSKNWAPWRECNWESAEFSGKLPKLGSRGTINLVT